MVKNKTLTLLRYWSHFKVHRLHASIIRNVVLCMLTQCQEALKDIIKSKPCGQSFALACNEKQSTHKAKEAKRFDLNSILQQRFPLQFFSQVGPSAYARAHNMIHVVICDTTHDLDL